MARGDKVRTLGKKLDDVHTSLVKAWGRFNDKINQLDGILSEGIIEELKDMHHDFNSANDEVENVYCELAETADELDADESEDESTKRELEKELATVQGRIEELENEDGADNDA